MEAAWKRDYDVVMQMQLEELKLFPTAERQGLLGTLERLSSSSAPADACKDKPYIGMLSCSWRS